MSTQYTQQQRRLNIATVLGEDAIFLESFEGEERFSHLYTYYLELVSKDSSIQPESLVGSPVQFAIRFDGDDIRYFGGYFSQFAASSLNAQGLRKYRAQVVPWLWFLTLNSNCRIFQQTTIPDIVEQIFSERGCDDYELQLRDDHPEYEYCVQHSESDFDFISRWLEREGIFYFFRHGDEKNTLVLTDNISAYETAQPEDLIYSDGNPTEPHISQWEQGQQFRTGRIAQTDFDFLKPRTSLESTSNTLVEHNGNKSFERFEYPGTYFEKERGDAYARIRMEELESDHRITRASSNYPHLAPGAKFNLTQHDCESEKGAYAVSSIQHMASEPTTYETGPAAGGEYYDNRLECIPADVSYRPRRKTRVPVMRGPQTAIVVGPPGEEIWPDENGRVRVQFHWDREGQMDDNSSCWIRVSQSYAGARWGTIAIPRIGHEVIVDFLNGDPDRPIITGRVYNADNMPPWELPANKNITGLKTNSTPGGGGYNEISCDDTKGEELVVIHAERDLDATIERNETRCVREGTQSVSVKGNASLVVEAGHRIVRVDAGDYNLQAASKIIEQGKAGVEIKGTGSGVTIEGDPAVRVYGSSNVEVKAPDIWANGDKIKLEAGVIELVAGGGSIVIDGSGVTIKGSKIVAASEGPVDIDGSVVDINGGVVNLNC